MTCQRLSTRRWWEGSRRASRSGAGTGVVARGIHGFELGECGSSGLASRSLTVDMMEDSLGYMRTEAPLLAPIFRSDGQARLLSTVLLTGDELSLTDLAERAGLAYPTAHREVARLIDAGILSERHVGRTRLIRANGESPLVEPLREILTIVTGPVVILAEDAGGAAYVGYVWALATAGQDVRATLAHTAERALRGLPPNVKQVHLGAGAAGADLAPARRLVAALESNPALAKALPVRYFAELGLPALAEK